MTEISRRDIIVAVGGSAATAAAAGVLLVGSRPSHRPTRGRGHRTSFGSVALLGTSRLVLAPAGTASHGHASGHAVSQEPVASAVHGAWTDAVVVDLEVHNGLRRAMELSPGQFRVRVDADGPTVSLYSADRDAGPVAAGSTTKLRIRYLVPPPDRLLSLEFADTESTTPVALGRLGGSASQGLRS